MVLSYKDIKITKIHVKESTREGGQLAWTNGTFQQRHRNFKKKSSAKTRNNKPWRREESDFQSCHVVLKVLFLTSHKTCKDTRKHDPYQAVKRHRHWGSRDIELTKILISYFKYVQEIKKIVSKDLKGDMTKMSHQIVSIDYFRK